MKNKGFTLIELLVVLAIIGILSSILMVNLQDIRREARDTRIISEMNSLRNKAELAIMSQGNYAALDQDVQGCSFDSKTKVLCNDIDKQCFSGVGNCAGDDASGGDQDVQIWANNSGFCAYTGLNSGQYYCVDSRGINKKFSEKPVCSDGNYSCN